MNNRRILVWAIVGLLVLAAIFFGGYYLYLTVIRVAQRAAFEDLRLASPVTSVPTASAISNLPFTPIPAGWSLAGIVKKIDFQEKFFEINMVPLYPVSFLRSGFNDAVRIYFGEDLIFPHIRVEIENGVWTRIDRRADFSLEHLGPGKPVRAVGGTRPDGTYYARMLYIYDFERK